jgi:cell division protein FtsW (lipid II flippase)
MTSDTARSYFIPRNDEGRLLCIAFTATVWIFLGSFSVWCNGSGMSYRAWYLPAAYCVSILLAHGLLVMTGSKADQTILPTAVFLGGIGFSYQYRLQNFSGCATRDCLQWIVVATPLIIALTCIIFRRNRLDWMRKSGWLWILLMMGIPVMMIFLGVNYRGSRFGPHRTTPAEFGKLAALLSYAFLLTRYGSRIDKKVALFSRDSLRIHLLIGLLWGMPLVLYACHRDLGVVLISTLLFLILLHTSSGRRIYWLIGFIGAGAGAWIFKTFINRGTVRFHAWLDPFHHPADAGYQIIQSLFALFHGEVIGRGIGQGFPAKLPLVGSDFIYASLAEEIGLLGSSLVLLGFLYIARRGYIVASNAEDIFQILVASGSATLIWIQVLLNIGGVIKMIPMTGVPLPFISRGGSACLVFSVLIGWIMSISDG